MDCILDRVLSQNIASINLPAFMQNCFNHNRSQLQERQRRMFNHRVQCTHSTVSSPTCTLHIMKENDSSQEAQVAPLQHFRHDHSARSMPSCQPHSTRMASPTLLDTALLPRACHTRQALESQIALHTHLHRCTILLICNPQPHSLGHFWEPRRVQLRAV